jgi:signal peptidase II
LTQGSGRRARIVFVAIAALVVAIDQLTKHLSVVSLEGETPVKLLWGAVYLTLVRNPGAAFSMGTDYTFVFPLITLGVVCWILWMARSLASTPWAVGLGLVLGGALGNFGDRLFRSPGFFVGEVVDMISVLDDSGGRFPVFNAADSALFCGVVLLVLMEITGRRRDGSRIEADEKKDAADVAP